MPRACAKCTAASLRFSTRPHSAGVPKLILEKPELKPTLDKITPYQGWIGAISALWGLWGIISSILNIGWLTAAPIWWITLTANNALLLALGLLLGVGTMKTFIKNPEAQAKLDQTVVKIAPYQGTLGLGALGLGAWCVVASILFHHQTQPRRGAASARKCELTLRIVRPWGIIRA